VTKSALEALHTRDALYKLTPLLYFISRRSGTLSRQCTLSLLLRQLLLQQQLQLQQTTTTTLTYVSVLVSCHCNNFVSTTAATITTTTKAITTTIYLRRCSGKL